MLKKVSVIVPSGVALRKESVDRNLDIDYYKSWNHVALRKESVDRNFDLEPIKNAEAVALRTESVDRNIIYLLTASAFLIGRSPQGERG